MLSSVYWCLRYTGLRECQCPVLPNFKTVPKTKHYQVWEIDHHVFLPAEILFKIFIRLFSGRVNESEPMSDYAV